MPPWTLAAAATLVGAVAFFFAGFLLRGARSSHAPKTEAFIPADADIPTLLGLLAETTRSETTTLLDQHGLVVHGLQAVPHAQALAGSLATALDTATSHGLGESPGVFELRLADGRDVRLSCASVSGAVYVVATIGAEAAPAPELERRILAAIPRLAAA